MVCWQPSCSVQFIDGMKFGLVFHTRLCVLWFLLKQVFVYQDKADVKLDNCSFGVLGELFSR